MHFVNLCPNLAVGCHVENPVIILTHCCKTSYMASYSFFCCYLAGFLLDMVQEAVTVGCCITNAVVMSPREKSKWGNGS